MKKIFLSLLTFCIGLVAYAQSSVWVADPNVKLITSASQISSPYTETTEGSIESMIDGNADTFWHSTWTGGEVPSGTHYFEVEVSNMPEYFALRFTRRNTESDHITLWGIYGAPDSNSTKEECTLLGTWNTPYTSSTETYTSPVFESQGFTRLRFYCEETRGTYYNNGYFHLSEFQILGTKEIYGLVIGDMNYDGVVNIDDVTAVVNVALGKSLVETVPFGSNGGNQDITPTSLVMSESSLIIVPNNTHRLSVTTIPRNAYFEYLTWRSSDESVATVDGGGVVTGIQDGIATITATAAGSNVVATCNVTVCAPVIPDTHTYVDLGLPSGTLWATCNIGADSPEDYGDYFAWGETTGYTQDTSDGHSFDWASYKYAIDNWNTLTKYCNSSRYGYNGFTDSLTELELSDDAAYVNWGANWRMPTIGQFQELTNSNYTTTTWTTRNGVYGRLITSKMESYTDRSLFLPAAGFRSGTSLSGSSLSDTSLSGEGSYGYYWSRTLGTDLPYDARDLYIYSDDIYAYYYCDRYCGQSVRPVRLSQ